MKYYLFNVNSEQYSLSSNYLWVSTCWMLPTGIKNSQLLNSLDILFCLPFCGSLTSYVIIFYLVIKKTFGEKVIQQYFILKQKGIKIVLWRIYSKYQKFVIYLKLHGFPVFIQSEKEVECLPTLCDLVFCFVLFWLVTNVVQFHLVLEFLSSRF